MTREDRETWASPSFAAEVRTEADQTRLVLLSGEIDLASAEALREVFVSSRIMNASALRVDLTGVTVLGSVGISVLISACKRVRASGGTFSIVCGRDMCRRVLEISGLIEYLEVEDVA